MHEDEDMVECEDCNWSGCSEELVCLDDEEPPKFIHCPDCESTNIVDQLLHLADEIKTTPHTGLVALCAGPPPGNAWWYTGRRLFSRLPQAYLLIS